VFAFNLIKNVALDFIAALLRLALFFWSFWTSDKMLQKQGKWTSLKSDIAKVVSGNVEFAPKQVAVKNQMLSELKLVRTVNKQE
jgi:hypothetical protein